MDDHSHPPLFPGELPPAEAVSGLARFRDSAVDSLFQVSRAFPKLLALRSTPSAWTAFRLALGIIGAGLVVLPLGLWNAWAFAPVGLVLFLLAVLLPPIRQDRGTAKAVQQLGAYLVLDGGRLACGPLSTENAAPCTINLYLTQTRVWALDPELRPVVVIPAEEINVVAAFPSQDDWLLRVSWLNGSAEFSFSGLFAERRARLAEHGLRHLVHSSERRAQEQPKAARAKAARV
jgi:hypothetical protein